MPRELSDRDAEQTSTDINECKALTISEAAVDMRIVTTARQRAVRTNRSDQVRTGERRNGGRSTPRFQHPVVIALPATATWYPHLPRTLALHPRWPANCGNRAAVRRRTESARRIAQQFAPTPRRRGP